MEIADDICFHSSCSGYSRSSGSQFFDQFEPGNILCMSALTSIGTVMGMKVAWRQSCAEAAKLAQLQRFMFCSCYKHLLVFSLKGLSTYL